MPEDLAGLCKLRVGDWRILYWIYHAETVVRITEFNTDPKCIGISRRFANACVETVNQSASPVSSLKAECHWSANHFVAEGGTTLLGAPAFAKATAWQVLRSTGSPNG